MDRIHITHIVNPHLFYFKWIKDINEFDESLDAFETQLKEHALKKQSEKKTSVVNRGQQVAVFFAGVHKWIRGYVQAKDKNDLVYLWCIDHGFPLVAQQSEVFPLPKEMYQFQPAKYKIHRGGISNAVPAEVEYDFAKNAKTTVAKSMWSPRALQLFCIALQNAASIQFKDIRMICVGTVDYKFGRIMVENSYGSTINIMKCLLDMNLTKIVEQKQFVEFVTKCSVTFQPNWKNIFDRPLNGAVLVSVFHSTQSTRFVDDTFKNAEEMILVNDENDVHCDDNISLTDEENAFFDSSVSVFETSGDAAFSIYLNSSSNSKASSRTVTLKRVDSKASSIKPQSAAKSQTEEGTIPQKQSFALKFGSLSLDSEASSNPNQTNVLDTTRSSNDTTRHTAETNAKPLPELHAVVSGRNQQYYAQNRNNSRPQYNNKQNSNERRNNARCSYKSTKNDQKDSVSTNNKQHDGDDLKNPDREADDALQTHDNGRRKNPFRRHGSFKPCSKPEE